MLAVKFQNVTLQNVTRSSSIGPRQAQPEDGLRPNLPGRARQDGGQVGYFDAESLASSATASCTVVMNCAGNMMVEFFSMEISAIVCSVRS